jgi:prophage regulatory protein
MLRIIRFGEVKTRTGLKHTALYDRIRDGTFPRPVPLGPKARGWIESEINDWIQQLVATRNARSDRSA